jgi:hypothetical protein
VEVNVDERNGGDDQGPEPASPPVARPAGETAGRQAIIGLLLPVVLAMAVRTIGGWLQVPLATSQGVVTTAELLLAVAALALVTRRSQRPFAIACACASAMTALMCAACWQPFVMH